jgi:hypothetical protein
MIANVSFSASAGGARDLEGDIVGVGVLEGDIVGVTLIEGVREGLVPPDGDTVGEHVGGAARPENGPQQPVAQRIGAPDPAGQ